MPHHSWARNLLFWLTADGDASKSRVFSDSWIAAWQMMTIQKRGFYRIEYPAGVRPIMSVKGLTCQIVELSEGGGRVLVSDANSAWFKDGSEVTITFQSGDTATSEAKLVRIDGDKIVIRFSPPIPLPIIIEEQRLLIIQFPKD